MNFTVIIVDTQYIFALDLNKKNQLENCVQRISIQSTGIVAESNQDGIK